MKLLVITRDSQRGGQTKKTVNAEWVRVGRNASCEIHLPDPRIALEQGMIVHRDGLVYLEGETGVVTKSTTRKSVRSVRLNPGQPIEVGPYRFEAVATPAGFDGAVSVELVHPLEIGSDFASRTSRLTLGSLGLTKRWAAWSWAIFVLLVFLALPAAKVLHMPWAMTASKLGFDDRFWDPGPVMLAHQPIERQCDACHQIAFRHVQNGACLECHSKIGAHHAVALAKTGLRSTDPRLRGDDRCTTCHREHKGVKATHRDDDRFCVECHRDIKAELHDAKTPNVTDFAGDHPDFRVAAVQDPHLKFTHEKHLDPKGVKSPAKGRVKLDCGDCHKPDASKRTFEPISMAKVCQDCHMLQFEPAVTTREVPHGKPEEAVTVIEEFYANLALKGEADSFQKAFGVPGQGLLRRVGDPSPGERQNALALAGRKARKVTADLFEVRVCKTCHDVSRDGATWKIAEVDLKEHWMPHARFDHKAHAQTKCTECHDVTHSKQSSDVTMPTIKTCRECHGGAKPTLQKITSNCLLCHGFHDPKHPWDPGFKPRSR